MTARPILVAGVGNVFLGDDGFGVEVVRRLASRPLPPTVRVADFGIRGLDFAYALLEPYELVIVVDASRRGGASGHRSTCWRGTRREGALRRSRPMA